MELVFCCSVSRVASRYSEVTEDSIVPTYLIKFDCKPVDNFSLLGRRERDMADYVMQKTARILVLLKELCGRLEILRISFLWSSKSLQMETLIWRGLFSKQP